MPYFSMVPRRGMTAVLPSGASANELPRFISRPSCSSITGTGWLSDSGLPSASEASRDNSRCTRSKLASASRKEMNHLPRHTALYRNEKTIVTPLKTNTY
ncbi:hypothetical protein [Phocaeicola sp.]|uniref:hypothetical protein n=1 Tax=Phocaeicola sp. TaxID=2773926 RepID=UPI0025E0CB0E|nr:hypothetical protein [uncultured Phocaeicola sp.]